MVTIIYRKKKVEVPSDLEELSPEQYIQYLEYVIMLNMGTLTPHEMKCQLLSMLLGMRSAFTLYVENTVNELLPQLDQMNSFFDIKEENGVLVYDPHIKTGRNLLKEYDGYVGPDDMCNNITWGTFIRCLNITSSISEAYLEQNEEDILFWMTSLCESLYKHKQFGNKSRYPILLSYHAYYFFSSVWELVRTVPIPINGKELDFSILFQSSGDSSKKDDNTGWTGISFEVATSGVFGNTRQVNNTPFWDVLTYLYKCRFEYNNNKDKE